MYTKESRNEQLNLFSDKLLAPFLDSENELFKITKTLDWIKLSDKLSEFYSPGNGRPTKSSRLKIGLLVLKHLSFDNTSDSQLLDISLKGYQERFGYFPTQLAADRGFWPQENRQLAQNYGIKKIAIENKGKPSSLKGKPFRERLRRLRCKIEAKISLSKRKYGLGCTRCRIPQGEEVWIRLGLIAMNLKTSVGYG